MRHFSTIIILAILAEYAVRGSAGDVHRHVPAGPYNADDLHEVCRSLRKLPARAGIPNVRELLRYIQEAGYTDRGRVFFEEDPGCEMLAEGIDSTEFLLFKAAVVQAKSLYEAAFDKLVRLESYQPHKAMDAARRVFDHLMGFSGIQCILTGGGAHRDCRLRSFSLVHEGNSVRIALFLKFGFSVLAKGDDIENLFRAVTGVTTAVAGVTLEQLKALHKRSLSKLHTQLLRAGSSVEAAITGKPRVDQVITVIKNHS